MEESVGKLGIIDFFNVLFAGGIFVISIWWIFPCSLKLYSDFKSGFEKEAYVCILIIAFAVGLILQEFGAFLDQSLFHVKSNVMGNFLRSIDIIDNDIKFEVYREYGKCILKNKGLEVTKYFNQIQCKFIYAYCVYYIENKEKNGKYEKMSGLFDLSRTLVGASLVLTCLGIIKSLLNLCLYCCQGTNYLLISIMQTLVFAVLGIIFLKRAEKIMKYRARMLMEVYDICMENDKGNKQKSLTKDE